MKKLLIISPRFPPVNAADHHRVRTALPYMREFGWEPHVLAVDPDFIPNERDPLLEKSLPRSLPLTRCAALSERATRPFGITSLALRCYRGMKRAGEGLLASGNYDLVFFSTTEFPVFALGAGWKEKFGVPFVIDLQDPWVSDYHSKGKAMPPGGRLKYESMQALAKYLEPRTLRACAGVVTVSPSYPEMLAQRYGWFDKNKCAVLPFAASENDFALLAESTVMLPDCVSAWKGTRWVYVGRGGEDMAFSVRAFMTALARARRSEPERWNRLRIYFIGTDYAPGARARRSILPVAESCGVSDLVIEEAERIPYFQALAVLQAADALVVPGSDDPGYTASKIYPYVQSKKPLLGIFHERSSVLPLLEKTHAGIAVPFAETTKAESDRVSQVIAEKWFNGGHSRPPETDWAAFAPYTAKEMTRILCSTFDKMAGCA